MPDRVKADFNFSNSKNIIVVHGEFLLSYSGEHLSPVYKRKGFKKALNLEGVYGIAEFYIKYIIVII